MEGECGGRRLRTEAQRSSASPKRPWTKKTSSVRARLLVPWGDRVASITKAVVPFADDSRVTDGPPGDDPGTPRLGGPNPHGMGG